MLTADKPSTDALKVNAQEHGSSQEEMTNQGEAGIRTIESVGHTITRTSPLVAPLAVYIDPRTWGALLFTLLSLVTGAVYFTWAVAGLSLSLALLVLIIGAPFAFLFLLSVQGLAQVEASLVNALLGVRIQARPVLWQPDPKWPRRLTALAKDGRTWSAMLYLVLQLPLGVIHFSLDTFMLAFSLGVMALPFAFMFGNPVIMPAGPETLALRASVSAVTELAGFLMLTASLHVIRALGRFHGRYAQGLLGW